MAVDVRQKVLIVDDDPLNVEILRSLLMDDYDVMVAHNGADAIATAERGSPDLVLLDIIMPNMDGYEVFARLKQVEHLKDVPVLFITILNEAECEAKGLGMGAHDYVIKPFNPTLVRLRVKNHIEFKRQRDMLAARTAELEKTIDDLRFAQANVQKLEQLLPICAVCKKIRDGQGAWKHIDTYLNEHAGLEFSHGICEACAGRLYPGYDKSSK